MTVAKMIEARRILRHYHNDLEAEPACMVIGSKQESDLLSQVQVAVHLHPLVHALPWQREVQRALHKPS